MPGELPTHPPPGGDGAIYSDQRHLCRAVDVIDQVRRVWRFAFEELSHGPADLGQDEGVISLDYLFAIAQLRSL